MITKALERQYASFTQIVLTMSPILNIEKQKDPVGYLRQFHQNSDVKTDLNDIGNMLGDIEENYTCMTNADETMYILSAIYEGTTGNIVADNKEQLMSIYDFLKSDKLNDKFIPAKEATYRFKDADKSAHFNSIPVAEATRGDLNRVNRSIRQLSDPNAPAPNGNGIRAITALNQASSISSKIDSDMKAEAAKVQDRQDKLDQNAINNQLAHEQLDQNKDQFDQNMDQRKAEFEHQKQMDSIRNKPKLKDLDVKLADNVLKDNDVKKSNELVPTTLHIRVKTVNNKGEDVGFLDFIVGVKSTMHPIKSDEMVINMVSACKNNNKFFDFIRWTTGEISFFKDFVFNIKELKDDVVSRSAGSSSWWMTLKRRRALAKIKNGLVLPQQILPNATVVLSMEEVEYIKSEYGYDLMNTVFVDKIMQTYFLLGFVVVDNSTQIAHFLFDGQQNFQSVTFSGLERENSGDERKFKEMLKVINRN
jgi:hypothetical protein